MRSHKWRNTLKKYDEANEDQELNTLLKVIANFSVDSKIFMEQL